MAKYRVVAAVVGSKYLGEFKADSADEALAKALTSNEAGVCLCHQCSSECEDPWIDEENSSVELVEDES